MLKVVPRRDLPFYVAAATGVLAALLSYWLAPKLWFAGGADLFFIVFLAMTALRLPKLTAQFLREHARETDDPPWLIFAVTVGTAFVALSSLIVMVNRAGDPSPIAFGLGLASVPLGWFTIHLMASMHYAHLYWADGEDDADTEAAGLAFPDEGEPEGWDFVYFGFTIGMTAQTSDTEVDATGMRKFVLAHSVISFFFNTVLLAATINVAVAK